MLKYIALFFSGSLLLLSCSGDKPPAGVLDEGSMTSLLTDVHILDGRLYAVTQSPDSLYKYGAGRYRALFKKFHTDSTQFKTSLKYYSSQPVELLNIYDQVLANLKKKTDSLQKEQMTPHAIPR